MPIRIKASGDPIVQRLRTLVKGSPDLKDAAKFYEAVQPILRDADLRVASISMTPEEARSKMGSGRPLLSDLDLDLDTVAVRELMLELAEAVESAGRKDQSHKRLFWGRISHEPDAAARCIRVALEDNRLDIIELLTDISAGERGRVTAAAQDLQLDPGLLWILAQNALKPALREWCRQLTPLASGVPWNRGACFVCGAAPALAELQGNDQVKHLRCGSCGADWQSRRVQCAHCGNEDHTTLQCLYDERNREKTRIEVCEKCKGYLKVISSFAPTSADMLAIEDLATLPLDYIAEERGYVRQAVRHPV
jgi:FdhE protein